MDHKKYTHLAKNLLLGILFLLVNEIYSPRVYDTIIANNIPDGLCGGSLAKAMGGPALISDAAAKAIFHVNPNSNVVLVK